MDVQLYVYDLTNGMARAMSKSFLGIQIDAVYHTSIVYNGIEYFFGAGVQMSYPGRTHHGAPMEIVPLGQTQLPDEVILDYLESLKEIYTPESYDLFAHNCNNFSQDFAMFLVGRGIPDHITNLPKQVLDTPFGQMLRPQIEQSMKTVTQAPVPPSAAVPGSSETRANGTNGMHSQTSQTSSTAKAAAEPHGSVYNVTELSVLNDLLSKASSTCAVIFFTSSTCAPCKMAYPTYDALAAEFPKSTLIKVDINAAWEIGTKYAIRATPTFMTFFHGNKGNEWTGANPSQLRGNVEMLVRQAFPPHPHATLRVPSLSSGSLRPVTFTKIPPLDKVVAKMGPAAAQDPSIKALSAFISSRTNKAAQEAPLPDMHSIATFLRKTPEMLSKETLFTALDLLRCALLDKRVSSWFAEEDIHSSTTMTLLSHVSSLISDGACPYNLRLCAVQLGANLFSSPLSITSIFTPQSQLSRLLVQLAASSLLSDHDRPAVRASASSLAFNLAAINYRTRREEGRELLSEGLSVELAAGLLEMLGEEADALAAAEGEERAMEPINAALMALGYLVYFGPVDGEVWDLCTALEARSTVNRLRAVRGVSKLANEVAQCLPGSG